MNLSSLEEQKVDPGASLMSILVTTFQVSLYIGQEVGEGEWFNKGVIWVKFVKVGPFPHLYPLSTNSILWLHVHSINQV